MKTIKIFREGIADEKFLRDLIANFFKRETQNVEFVDFEGHTNFRKASPSFIANTLSGGKNLLVLDADTPDEGGFKNRLEYVESEKQKYNIEFELFLFPNHKEDGNLETLLDKIINPKNKGIIECWDNYVECLSAQKKPDGKEVDKPNLKKKIFTYLDLLDGTNTKEADRNYLNTDHWNLDSEALKPLKDFLRTHF